ncbi:Eco57I restriction-modification methylase domain-containing protein [Candidatus Sumerlaeota bacterium]
MARPHLHDDWMSLIEVSGPFLSRPVLQSALPQGLQPHDPGHFRNLRLAHEEWDANTETRRPDPAVHNAWCRFILTETLHFPDEVIAEDQAIQNIKTTVAEYHETLRPDIAIVNPSGVADESKPRLLIKIYPPEQNLEKKVPGMRWAASPSTRMAELLHGTNTVLGLVTNGEQWMLVYAPRGETTTFATWYAHLWLEEQTTLQAFREILGADRFFSVAENQTLEAMMAESVSNQEEVTDQLGYQVRQAVEVLVQSLDRADQDHGRQLLDRVSEQHLYNASLTVMMRLVFLFAAEEKGLFPLDDEFYASNYAVSVMREQLREKADKHGEEILERSGDAWCRILAVCRMIFGGAYHDRFHLPAYGSNLFDPDRYPFLEGREGHTSWRDTLASPLPINNRTVLHLLEALQILEMRGPGKGPSEARRLSFRALDIEQIGHVYEGLLDHTARRDPEPVLGLTGSKDKEPEILLPELEKLAAKSQDELVKFLKKETGRSPATLKKLLAYQPEPLDLDRLRRVCGGDDHFFERVLPFFALVRNDTLDLPVVIRSGSVYVTAGTDRRTTGTHYTPRSLTEPIVQHTLEPILYPEMAEGKSKEDSRSLSAREALELKICDMAMGSGAFLVQTCRFLGDYIVQKWSDAEAEAERRGDKSLVLTAPFADPATGRIEERPLPKDEDERRTIARRLVCERCLYGVDKNPMAVEMAKLSLWLITLDKNRPFTFLDHAFKCGDSLLGIADPKQIEMFHIDPAKGESLNHDFVNSDAAGVCIGALAKATELRRRLESFTVNSAADSQKKRALLDEAEKAVRDVRLIGDLLVGAAMSAAADKRTKINDLIQEWMPDVFLALDEGFAEEDRKSTITKLTEKAYRALNDGKRPEHDERTPFHWAVEFPEVFSNGSRGFHAIVGNPPFQGGQMITGAVGTDYRDYLVNHLAAGKKGSADLCAYFFLRAANLLCENGGFGLIATNSISQGDTRGVGLDQLIKSGFAIPRAIPSRKWPGVANLEIAEVWIRKGKWAAPHVLEEQEVKGITPYLVIPGKVVGEPHRLKANEGKSFQGSIVLGMGFVMSPEEAQALIDKNSRNKDVLFPYLIGDDLNSRPDQSPSRWVINFCDWPLNRTADGSWLETDGKERKEYLRSGIVPADYPDPVAADYPDCLEIIERLVKPERTRLKEDGSYALRYPLYLKWWIYGEKRPALYAAIADMERVLVRGRISPTPTFSFVASDQVIEASIVILTLSRLSEFSSIQSSIHYVWAEHYTPTFGKTTFVYAPSHCFDNFPFPDLEPESSPITFSELESIGESYHEHRRRIMLERDDGLTTTHNRFQNLEETSDDIAKLRHLHVEMDKAVAAAYGWDDLDLGHGFHETKQGLRYTICEEARREILDRLLELNHQRYAEEVAAGLHAKKKPKSNRKTTRKSKKPKIDTENELPGLDLPINF